MAAVAGPAHQGAPVSAGEDLSRLRVLVTNDDGSSPAVTEIVAALLPASGQLSVVIPEREHGGVGTSIRNGPGPATLPVPTTASSVSGCPIHQVDASPALIVLAACEGCFGPPPDVVVVGPNYGPNVGTPILYSGTVGAALTAVECGVMAVAVSVDDVFSTHGVEDGDIFWGAAAAVTVPAVRDWVSIGAGALMNVNVPNRPAAELKGWQLTTLATPKLRLGAFDDSSPAGVQLKVRPTFEIDRQDFDTDIAALAGGYVSVTPLRGPKSWAAGGRRFTRQHFPALSTGSEGGKISAAWRCRT